MPKEINDPPGARTWPTFATAAAPLACRQPDVDPEIFYPRPDTARADATAAKAVCARCDLTRECLDWALDTDQRHGIWGGHTAVERHHERRRRHRQARAGATR